MQAVRSEIAAEPAKYPAASKRLSALNKILYTGIFILSALAGVHFSLFITQYKGDMSSKFVRIPSVNCFFFALRIY